MFTKQLRLPIDFQISTYIIHYLVSYLLKRCGEVIELLGNAILQIRHICFVLVNIYILIEYMPSLSEHNECPTFTIHIAANFSIFFRSVIIFKAEFSGAVIPPNINTLPW